MTNRGKHFQRFGRGVFTCSICSRGTRLAGQGGDSNLCPECWELAGYENSLNDNGWLDAPDVEFVATLFKKAVKQGSNPDKLKAAFPELLAAKAREVSQ